MQIRNVLFTGLVVLMIGLSLGLAIISEAAVFWTDDFENQLTPNWDTSSCSNGTIYPGPQNGCVPLTIDTNWAQSGTHSLHSVYNCSAGMTTSDGSCGPFYDRFHTPTTDVYMRWYMKFTNFVVNPLAGSKQMYNKSNSSDSWLVFWHIFEGDNQLAVQAAHGGWITDCKNGTGLDASCNYYPNLTHVNINDGKAHCIETHVNAGTAGNANGILDIWVDGIQTMHLTGIPIATPQGGSFNHITHYLQLGQGDRNIDDLAVGNSRIGCSGTSSTPPAAPTGLTVQ